MRRLRSYKGCSISTASSSLNRPSPCGCTRVGMRYSFHQSWNTSPPPLLLPGQLLPREVCSTDWSRGRQEAWGRERTQNWAGKTGCQVWTLDGFVRNLECVSWNSFFHFRKERELLLLEKEQELERLRVQHEREIYLMKKKLSTAAAPTRPLPAPAALINLSIPRYHTVSGLLNLLLVTSVI